MQAKKTKVSKAKGKTKKKATPTRAKQPLASTDSLLLELLHEIRGAKTQEPVIEQSPRSEYPKDIQLDSKRQSFGNTEMVNNEYSYEFTLSKLHTTAAIVERLQQDVDTMKNQLAGVIQRVFK